MAIGLLACALPLGCGEGKEATSAAQPPAAPLSSRVLLSGNVPRVRPAQLAGPIAAYRRYVPTQLIPMEADLAQLREALAAGDLAGARGAWIEADSRYEAIGAAYGAFGDLDASINGEPGGLPGGLRSPEFTGLHRIELALWGHDSTAEAVPYAERLAADVATLRRQVAGIEIEPLEYVLRSHEVLEGTLDLQLSGRASPWSSDALVALRSNLKGTEVVLGTLRPMIRRRSPQVLQRIESSLEDLAAAVRSVEGAGGAMPRWDTLPAARRTEVAGLAAAAAEQLAYVPEIVDPRPLLPVKPALGVQEAG
jgi:iron uptake system EfeUOB component EfeO/EfeM